MGPADQFDLIRGVYPESELWNERGQPFVYLPKLQFAYRLGKAQMDVLLCPHEHPGYPTRLFLSKKLEGTGANFNSDPVICGRPWYAASWDKVPASLPWLEILACHLKAFQ